MGLGNVYSLYDTKYISYYPTKPYDVGSQNDCLVDRIILSTRNIGLEGQIRISEQKTNI